MRECIVEGCSDRHDAKGYCKKHYGQMHRHGKILERTRFDMNEYEIKDCYAEMWLYDLHGNKIANTTIDLEDVIRCKQFKWYKTPMGYPARRDGSTLILLHRFLMGPDHLHVDHIDRNKMNNRKSNLRLATRSENLCNQKTSLRNSSGYKGVSWNKRRGKWHCYITKDQRRHHLGYFDSVREAAVKYNESAIKLHGEFARLNVV